jgi:hypothetical protein
MISLDVKGNGPRRNPGFEKGCGKTPIPRHSHASGIPECIEKTGIPVSAGMTLQKEKRVFRHPNKKTCTGGLSAINRVERKFNHGRRSPWLRNR